MCIKVNYYLSSKNISSTSFQAGSIPRGINAVDLKSFSRASLCEVSRTGKDLEVKFAEGMFKFGLCLTQICFSSRICPSFAIIFVRKLQYLK